VKKVALLLLVLVVMTACPKVPRKKPSPAVKPVVGPAQKATHMIRFYDGDFSHDEDALCTATAIGPHALITDEHCNFSSQPDKVVILDLTKHRYHIVAIARDGNDHLILLLDGDPLGTYVKIETRPPVVGEHVTMYGDGEGAYPPEKREGTVIAFDDPSDLDLAAGLTFYNLNVIPGDSGSAVFGDDGKLVGLVTYRHEDEVQNWFEKLFHKHHTVVTGAGFPIRFTKKDLKTALQFDGKDLSILY
jgi:hypothetical protein